MHKHKVGDKVRVRITPRVIRESQKGPWGSFENPDKEIMNTVLYKKKYFDNKVGKVLKTEWDDSEVLVKFKNTKPKTLWFTDFEIKLEKRGKNTSVKAHKRRVG